MKSCAKNSFKYNWLLKWPGKVIQVEPGTPFPVVVVPGRVISINSIFFWPHPLRGGMRFGTLKLPPRKWLIPAGPEGCVEKSARNLPKAGEVDILSDGNLRMSRR
jgi:hypothetical protein